MPTPVYRRKIAKGDDRIFVASFFQNPTLDVDVNQTSSRVHSQLTIIPFKELDQDGIKDGTIQDAVGESTNFLFCFWHLLGGCIFESQGGRLAELHPRKDPP